MGKNSVFPKPEFDEYYSSLSHKLSDFFQAGRVEAEGRFASTQLADTDIPDSICYCESPQYIELIKKQTSGCIMQSLTTWRIEPYSSQG
jgi:hypothetical protein